MVLRVAFFFSWPGGPDAITNGQRNSRADFPSGQQEVPGKKLGRKQNDLEISPKIDRFSRLDLERFPFGRFIFQCYTTNLDEKGDPLRGSCDTLWKAYSNLALVSRCRGPTERGALYIYPWDA